MELRPSILLDDEEDSTFYVEDRDGTRLAEGFETWGDGYNWILENRSKNKAISLWEREMLTQDSGVLFMGDFESYKEVKETVEDSGNFMDDGFYELVNTADQVVGVVWRGVLYVERR